LRGDVEVTAIVPLLGCVNVSAYWLSVNVAPTVLALSMVTVQPEVVMPRQAPVHDPNEYPVAAVALMVTWVPCGNDNTAFAGVVDETAMSPLDGVVKVSG
jgi:hypothetical protein